MKFAAFVIASIMCASASAQAPMPDPVGDGGTPSVVSPCEELRGLMTLCDFALIEIEANIDQLNADWRLACDERRTAQLELNWVIESNPFAIELISQLRLKVMAADSKVNQILAQIDEWIGLRRLTRQLRDEYDQQFTAMGC